MTDANETIHFEDLWEEAERLNHKISTDKNISTEDLMQSFVGSVEELQGFIKNPPTNISENMQKLLLQRLIGETIFHLSAVSGAVDINVYAALQDQVLLGSIPEED